jgi:hypothetical protein
MRAVLAAALVLSVGVNAWLAMRASEPAVVEETKTVVLDPAVATPAPQRRGAADATTKDTEDLRARVADLEKRLAVAEEKAADLDAMDPLGVLIYSAKPMAWKARRIAQIEPEKERMTTAWNLGRALADKPAAAGQVLAALKEETEPKAVGVLGELLRAGGATKASPEDRRGFAELLRTGATSEVRRACVRGVWMHDGGRMGDEKAKALAKELNAALVEAVKTDASPEVVGAVASAFADWSPPPEAMDALKDAGTRLPPSPGRRQVWEAIARGSFMGDWGAGLVQQFESTTVQDVRDDIAAGIARAGNSMSGGVGGTPEEAKKRLDDARARFRTVFSGTSDLAVRRTLARAACYGLNCVSHATLQSEEQKADAARFFREVAGLEPDATQRGRFERIATAFETKGGMAYQDFDKINSGRE